MGDLVSRIIIRITRVTTLVMGVRVSLIRRVDTVCGFGT